MSELSVGALSGLAANSYVIDVASGSTLDVTNATGTLPAAQLPAGSILQVVSTTKTDTFTTTSAGFTDITGLSASITPKSTSSKIYCVATVNGASTNGNDSSRAMVRLLRDATPIAVGDADGSRTQMSFNLSTRGLNSGKILMNGTVNFLDSPATTSTTTYKMQVASEGVTAFINRQEADANNSDVGLAVSSITLMEVAG